jgi:hypothetical protein
MLCSELPQPATEQITAAAAAALNALPDAAAAGVRPPAEAALSPSSPPLEEGGGDLVEEREAAGQSGPDLEEANSLPMMVATNGEAEQTKGCRAVFCCSEMCS